MEDDKIKDILLSEGYVSEADMKQAVSFAKDKQVSLVEALFDNDILTKDIFGQAIAEHFGVSFLNLSTQKIDDETLHLVPEIVAKDKQVVAVFQDENELKLGMVNPDDFETQYNIEKRAGKKVKVFYITPLDLATALETYQGSIADEFSKILNDLQSTDIDRDESDNLIVEMVDKLFAYGAQNKASDIHIEPTRDKVVVRFRVDGVMHKVLEIPKSLHELILTRIKIVSKMRTDEHMAAQDGKLRFDYQGEAVDVRVSIVPIVEGENVVMRLLSSRSRRFNLADLGFSESNFNIVKEVIKSPHGMILVTGPTGSGKTTTLYAILKILNNPKLHVSTIEDPVEYDIEGVSQIQVNPKTNLTFAKGLRAIVRQDPDIIMVGEIRDKETAGIAINSALTGHLVLSTLHTNDAVTTLPRLIDMDVEPYLVASTVNIVIAQRLVRKICSHCRATVKLDADMKKTLSLQPHVKEFLKTAKGDVSKINFYKGAGCKHCGSTGYSGRAGVFEILEMTDEVRQMVTKRSSSTELMKMARSQGMKTMMEDGLEKVLNGLTTLDEVLRVTKE